MNIQLLLVSRYRPIAVLSPDKNEMRHGYSVFCSDVASSSTQPEHTSPWHKS